MFDLNLVQSILLYAVPAVLAITVHEAAHGFAARYYGDRTAEMLGRLTLNPIKHIDPVGTILVPAALLIMAKTAGTPPLLFGWAKPVPVATRNLKNPHRDMVLVAAAGPASNLAMAVGWTLLMVLGSYVGGFAETGYFLIQMAYFGVIFNVLLAVFNMLPIPPLDGGRVLSGLLSPRAAMSFDRIEPYGFMIIVALLATGVLRHIIWPVVNSVTGVLLSVAGF